jgi:protein-L-isoaspartate(D-aspartate) O-methyltransferase
MDSQIELIALLKAEGVLNSPAVIKAMKAIDRADFVLPRYRSLAYENYPLSIGFGQTISQPYTVAFMLELLKVKKGEKILEIGAGSGWQTAMLCQLVGKAGRVVAVERLSKLKRLEHINLAKCHLYQNTITLIQGDGKLGYLAAAPYDKIIAAAAGSGIPEAWKQQLKIGGKIVAPVKHSIWEISKLSAESFKITRYKGFYFVPLV